MYTASSPAVDSALDGERWVRCRPGFFLPVRMLSRLFRRRFLEELVAAHRAARLQFFGDEAPLADARLFAQWLAPLRECEWVVYAKRPFAGPAAVLAYLSRYTHRVAISNRRLLALDERGVTSRWKDYRATGKTRYKAMTLGADEFMRRFLLHVLPSGLHRIRHYGLLANGGRREHLARARELLHVVPTAAQPPTLVAAPVAIVPPTFVCPHCGAAMMVIETFVYAKRPFAGPAAVLAYLSRYTHRVAIANSRLLAFDERGVTFRWKELPSQWQDALQGDDAQRRRVHPPLPVARSAQRLPPHPPLRSARQRRPARASRAGPRTTARRSSRDRTTGEGGSIRHERSAPPSSARTAAPR